MQQKQNNQNNQYILEDAFFIKSEKNLTFLKKLGFKKLTQNNVTNVMNYHMKRTLKNSNMPKSKNGNNLTLAQQLEFVAIKFASAVTENIKSNDLANINTIRVKFAHSSNRNMKYYATVRIIEPDFYFPGEYVDYKFLIHVVGNIQKKFEYKKKKETLIT
jgi:hypothetical protein